MTMQIDDADPAPRGRLKSRSAGCMSFLTHRSHDTQANDQNSFTYRPAIVFLKFDSN